MYKAKRKKISLATKKKKGNKKIRLKGVEEISVDRQNNLKKDYLPIIKTRWKGSLPLHA